MEVEVDLTTEDVVALNRHVLQTVPYFRRHIRLAWASLTLLTPALVWLTIRAGGRDPHVVELLVPTVVVFLLYPFLVRYRNRRTIERLLDSSSTAATLGPQRITITPDEITRHNNFGHSAFYWSAIDRVETTRDHLIVFIGATQAFLLPKRDFASEEEFSRFADAAHKYHREERMPTPYLRR